MPIIQLQRRLVEVGRLRDGEQKTAQSGKKYPAKLDVWRATSRDRQRLEAVAAVYGGAVRPWEDQHEVYTETDTLDIAVMPGQAISQHMEHWGQEKPKGPVLCLRRCDGQTEFLSDGPCRCRLESGEDGDLLCKPTTRLSVILRKVPGFGVWRVDSKGWNAANELAGMAELLEELTARGRPVPARLRLEQRTVVRADGNKNFVVPVIDLDLALDEVLRGVAPVQMLGASTAAIEAPAEPGVPFTPVPVEALPPGPQPTVAEQLAGAGTEPRPQRANAAEPIRQTGVKPRGVAGPASGGGADGPGSAPSNSGAEMRPSPSVPARGPELVNDEGAQLVGKWCSDAGIDGELRPAFLWAFSKGRYKSSHEVPVDDMPAIRSTLGLLSRGELVLDIDPDGERAPSLHEPGADAGSIIDATAVDVPPDVVWRARLKNAHGIGIAKLIRKARELAPGLGVALPKGLDDLTNPALCDALKRWLDEQHADVA